MQLDSKKTKQIKPEMIIMIILHLLFVFGLQTQALIGGDGIFTYTLANNPYAFEYIDPAYKYIPENNGWIDAGILRENYVVESYDRFNYSAVYFHQRLDNHPLLYYSLVHTVCSLFSGTYSKMVTMGINLIFLLGIDILFVKLFKKIYGTEKYAVVPFVCLFLSLIMQKLYLLPRMYLMLAFFCVWYLYIHWMLLANERWKKCWLIQMIFCIFLGTQTHYYFYVFAGIVTMLTLFYFMSRRYRYKIFNYMYSGVIGIAGSWILFPWIIWHIFYNQMNKHTDVRPWSFEKLSDYVEFLNTVLFNGRGIVAVLILFVLFLTLVLNNKRKLDQNQQIAKEHQVFKWIIGISGGLFSLIIYTLDESIWYYSTPFYLVFIMFFSMVLIDLFRKVLKHKKFETTAVVLSAACLLIIFSVSATVSFVKEQIDDNVIRENFSSVASEYKQYDCIFVEQRKDNLLQGYFFEFGDYDEFKKIAYEEFEQNGLRSEDLSGRSTEDGLVIYAPVECSMDEEAFVFLAGNGKYSVYIKVEK